MTERPLPGFEQLAALAADEDLHDFRDLPLALAVALPQLLRSAARLPDEHPRASDIRKLAPVPDALVQLTGLSCVAGEAGDMALAEATLAAAGLVFPHLGEGRPLFGLAVAASLRRSDRGAKCSACRVFAGARPLYVMPSVSETSVVCVACWKHAAGAVEVRGGSLGPRGGAW